MRVRIAFALALAFVASSLLFGRPARAQHAVTLDVGISSSGRFFAAVANDGHSPVAVQSLILSACDATGRTIVRVEKRLRSPKTIWPDSARVARFGPRIGDPRAIALFEAYLFDPVSSLLAADVWAPEVSVRINGFDDDDRPCVEFTNETSSDRVVSAQSQVIYRRGNKGINVDHPGFNLPAGESSGEIYLQDFVVEGATVIIRAFDAERNEIGKGERKHTP